MLEDKCVVRSYVTPGLEDLEDFGAWCDNACRDPAGGDTGGSNGPTTPRLCDDPGNDESGSDADTADTGERRYDTDSQPYTRKEFVAFYGGTCQWSTAIPEAGLGAAATSELCAMAVPYVPPSCSNRTLADVYAQYWTTLR